MIATSFALFLSLAVLSLAASRQIHEVAIRHLLRAPSAWLSIVPLGRLLAILGGDLGQVDADLDQSLRMLFKAITLFLAAVIIVGLMDGWLLLTLVATALPSIYMVRRYLPMYRDWRSLGASVSALLRRRCRRPGSCSSDQRGQRDSSRRRDPPSVWHARDGSQASVHSH